MLVGCPDSVSATGRGPESAGKSPVRRVPALHGCGRWRETTADAVYTQPDIPVPNTAGRPGAYTGSYGQLRLDWTIDRATSFAVEAVHFTIGDALRNAGAHDSNYLGVEIKRGW